MPVDKKHDHVRNGIAPVKGCDICDLLIKAVQNDEAKEPDGRMPPWCWDKDDK